MIRRSVLAISTVVLSFSLCATSLGQTSRGSISGRAVDSAGAVLPGARIDLQPGAATAVTSGQGEFNVSDLPAGEYTITVHYVGFTPFSTKVTVVAGQSARVDAKLQVASKNEEIMVYAERAHGEAAAINRERESDNILQVLPVEVITSLPNTKDSDSAHVKSWEFCWEPVTTGMAEA